MVVDGQVHGGVAQGIGGSAYEELVYDQDDGQLLSASFMDYLVPTAVEVPPIEVGHLVTPSPGRHRLPRQRPGLGPGRRPAAVRRPPHRAADHAAKGAGRDWHGAGGARGGLVAAQAERSSIMPPTVRMMRSQ
jgi:hypothetical protein